MIRQSHPKKQGSGQGRVKEIFGNMDNFIAQTKAPNVKKERKKLAPGIIRGLLVPREISWS